MVKQPGHFTSMKNDRGAGTRFWWRSSQLISFFKSIGSIMVIVAYLELVLARLSGRSRVE
jgi:hypothetical protein